MSTDREQVAHQIRYYMGLSDGAPVGVVPDPRMPDVWAAQYQGDGYVAQFVVTRIPLQGRGRWAYTWDVEEVEFTTWPPTSGECG